MKRFFLLSLFCCFVSLGFTQLKSGFTESSITSEIYRPVGIKFDPNGRAFVWERTGVVYVIDTTGQLLEEPLIDISEEVGAWGDHGCLGFALDPDFLDNGYFYLFYVVDRHHLIHFGTSNYMPDSTSSNEATIGRITRFQADPSNDLNQVLPGSRKVLLGETIETGIPILIASHGVGSLEFGSDGTLLASTGDAGSFLSDDTGNDPNSYYQQALDDGIITPKNNVGSYHSQMIDDLCGKILRLDPETGDGISSNPWFDPNDARSARSRVYALGLRNPFRFALKPNTGSHDPNDANPGTLYIGDVGGSKWEELNICDRPGMNFGHPLFEGYLEKQFFWNDNTLNPDAPNPLFQPGICDQEFFTFKQLIQQANADQNYVFVNSCDPNFTINPALTFAHDLPAFVYANKLNNAPPRGYIHTFNASGEVDTINMSDPNSPTNTNPFSGFSSLGGVFYEGDNFPEEYQGRYFHADYSWWIRTIDFNDENQIGPIERFHGNSAYVLDLAVHPKDGSLWYIGFQSRVRKIVYGGNYPPQAIINIDQHYGVSPLTINFDGSDSFDPDGTYLDFYWEFGDGVTSDLMNPTHTFVSENNEVKSFEVLLTVTDSLDAIHSQSIIISVNNTPPDVSISSVEDNSFYSVNGVNVIPLTADVSDNEHDDEALSYRWTTVLKHNTHEHPEEPDQNKNSQTFFSPVGCEDELYWYEIQLSVTDDGGLSGYDTVSVYPYCGDPFFLLKNWNGEVEKEQIRLSWETEFETDLDRFEIQRITSEDGIRSITSIPAQNRSADYQTYDPNPINGLNTYRLKVWQADGTYDFSPTIRIPYPALAPLKVYPNPTDEVLIFELVNMEADEIEVEIFDSAGKFLISYKYAQPLFKINVQNFHEGVYFYRVKNGESEYSGKWIKLP